MDDAARRAREITRACTHVVWHDTTFSAGGNALADAACWRCCDEAIAAALRRVVEELNEIDQEWGPIKVQLDHEGKTLKKILEERDALRTRCAELEESQEAQVEIIKGTRRTCLNVLDAALRELERGRALFAMSVERDAALAPDRRAEGT